MFWTLAVQGSLAGGRLVAACAFALLKSPKRQAHENLVITTANRIPVITLRN